MKKNLNQKNKSNSRHRTIRSRLKKGAFTVVVGAIVAVVYLLNQPTPGLSATPTVTQIEQGKRTFAQYCAACHGDNGQGQNPKFPGGGTGPGGLLLAPALNGKGHTWHHPDPMLFNKVKGGLQVKNSPMPAFGDTLDDQAIQSVLHYVKSLWPEEIRMRHSMGMKH